MDDKRRWCHKSQTRRESRQKAQSSRVSSLCLVGFDVDTDLVERGSEIGPVVGSVFECLEYDAEHEHMVLAIYGKTTLIGLFLLRILWYGKLRDEAN